MSPLTRRHFLQAVQASLAGWACSSWLPALSAQIADHPRRRRQCVLLWMTGGPSQMDTFDLKPGHANGGEFAEIDTNVPGLRICEHLPGLARQADQLAILRGLSTKEGDHGRGTHVMRTGHPPMGPVRYPAIGASLSKELADGRGSGLDYVSIAPFRDFNPAAFGPGFLGSKHAPLTVAEGNGAAGGEPGGRFAELRVDHLQPATGITAEKMARRSAMWRRMEEQVRGKRSAPSSEAHRTVYEAAMGLMASSLAEAFDLSREPDEIREAYGRGRFGQGCLMARRLIERGVPFVEVSLGTINGNSFGWDTHQNNFPAVKSLCRELDAGWSQLMTELQARGLLETTTILWLGEFGRTPQINNNAGRDHFPTAWTAVMAGGGIQGGQAFGKTSPDGMEVVDGKIDVGDLLATLSAALGVPPDRTNISDVGRPIKIAEGVAVSSIVKA